MSRNSTPQLERMTAAGRRDGARAVHAVAAVLGLKQRDDREVAVNDLRRRLERGVHHLVEGERAAQARGRVIEALVLVLGPLHRDEHVLGGDGVHDLLAGAGQIGVAIIERARPAAVGT